MATFKCRQCSEEYPDQSSPPLSCSCCGNQDFFIDYRSYLLLRNGKNHQDDTRKQLTDLEKKLFNYRTENARLLEQTSTLVASRVSITREKDQWFRQLLIISRENEDLTEQNRSLRDQEMSQEQELGDLRKQAFWCALIGIVFFFSTFTLTLSTMLKSPAKQQCRNPVNIQLQSIPNWR